VWPCRRTRSRQQPRLRRPRVGRRPRCDVAALRGPADHTEYRRRGSSVARNDRERTANVGETLVETSQRRLSR
jgi:hypothetical protein